MGKYRVDKRELSELLGVVWTSDLALLCELQGITKSQYVAGCEEVLTRGEQLGQKDLRTVASRLGELGESLLNVYNLSGQEIISLYSGLVSVISKGHMREWNTLTGRVSDQADRDVNMLSQYQFVPVFYRTICAPVLSEMTSDTVSHALSYLDSKSKERGIQEASFLLSYEECFGPKIAQITEDDISSVLQTEPTDEGAARRLYSGFRLKGISKVSDASRAMSFQVAQLPGRIQPMNVTFKMGMPERLPRVAAVAAEYIAGKRRF